MDLIGLVLADVAAGKMEDELILLYFAFLYAAVPMVFLGFANLSSQPQFLFFGLIQIVLLVLALRFVWRSIGVKADRTDWLALGAMFLVYFPICFLTNGICLVLAISLRAFS